MKTISKKAARIAGGVLLFSGVALVAGAIGAFANNQEVLGVFSLVYGLIGVAFGIFALSRKDIIRLSLSISGENHFIPFETSQKDEAEAKCKMLKDAKSEYERIACI